MNIDSRNDDGRLALVSTFRGAVCHDYTGSLRVRTGLSASITLREQQHPPVFPQKLETAAPSSHSGTTSSPQQYPYHPLSRLPKLCHEHRFKTSGRILREHVKYTLFPEFPIWFAERALGGGGSDNCVTRCTRRGKNMGYGIMITARRKERKKNGGSEGGCLLYTSDAADE